MGCESAERLRVETLELAWFSIRELPARKWRIRVLWEILALVTLRDSENLGLVP